MPQFDIGVSSGRVPTQVLKFEKMLKKLSGFLRSVDAALPFFLSIISTSFQNLTSSFDSNETVELVKHLVVIKV